MRDLILYTLAVAYLVAAIATIILIIFVAGLWIRYWFYKLFPKYKKRMMQRKKQNLIDKYMGGFDNE
jgi:hypothetical protein